MPDQNRFTNFNEVNTTSVANQVTSLIKSFNECEESSRMNMIEEEATEAKLLADSLESLNIDFDNMNKSAMMKSVIGGDAAIVSLDVDSETLDMEVDTGTCLSMVNNDTYSPKFSNVPINKKN